MVRILQESELRHVLAHMSLAIQEIAEGRPESALDDLRSVQGLIFYCLDDELTERNLRRQRMGKRKSKGKGGRKPNPCKGK